VYVTFKPAEWFEKQRATGQVTGQVGAESGAESNQVTGEVTGEVTKLLLAIRGTMSRQELQQGLLLKGEENFRRLYLVPALEAGFVEMTIPDKPQSRLQRYRRTEKGRNWLAAHAKDADTPKQP